METFEKEFPHSFVLGDYGVGIYPKTVDELDMINLSSSIREKPNWREKIKDPQIVAKWREEGSGQMSQCNQKIDYILAELLYYISIQDGSIEVAAVDGTWQSDELVDDNLKEQLIAGVNVLENVPESAKDWHPGSNGQVLDLVHPSLFCLVNGRTRVLRNAHAIDAIPRPSCSSQSQEGNSLINFASNESLLSSEEVTSLAVAHTKGFPCSFTSAKFQWLPSDFKVDESGSVRILSYINNLHPENHWELYSCIGKIFEKFVPLFNKVLTDLRNPAPNRIAVNDYMWYEYESCSNDNDDDEEEDEEVERPQRVPKPLDIPIFSPPESPKTVVNLAGRTLQVIVKLANIHLAPNKPEYPGGSWHIEGMANERIVASGIYYYSSENITESRLMFRQAVQEPDYEQNDDTGVERVYGLRNEHALNQNLGSIVTKEGRCIAFPNIIQHRVAPFKLEDITRPGHRKILVFFLVDPTVSIISTARVPPQQKSWFIEEVTTMPLIFPKEITEKIIGKLDWPMSLEEAKKHRDELMNERKYFVKNYNEQLFERPFYLCEH